jgi:L-threonylcarbamoyladenylate synthase
MDKLELSKAITALLNGKVIVYPTDTLYGLGADIYNDDAVRKIFEIKKRPNSIPLPVAVSDFDELKKIAFVDDKTQHLAESFLPGKLTLILNKKDCVPDVVTSKLDKVAVRIPDNKIALELLSKFGPLTVTSANIHGTKTPGIISDISMQFKDDDVAVYLDIGELDGQPSTIVDMTEKKIKIVREGAISKRDILDAI